MEALPVLLAILAFAGYWVLRNWLATVARRDMERRGRRGWLLDTAVFWWTPVGLIFWLIARLRHPIVQGEEQNRIEGTSAEG